MIQLTAPSAKAVADRYAQASDYVTTEFRVTMDELGKYTLQRLQEHANVQTGTLKNSMTYKLEPSGTGYKIPFNASAKAVSDGSYYVNYVDQGTKPHYIRARNKLALHFIDSSGTERFVQVVYHPGAKAAKFSEKAAKDAESRLEVLTKQFTAAIAKKVNG